MKEFLTEWLIRYGTEWVNISDLDMEAHKVDDGVINAYVDAYHLTHYSRRDEYKYRITPKALELIKTGE